MAGGCGYRVERPRRSGGAHPVGACAAAGDLGALPVGDLLRGDAIGLTPAHHAAENGHEPVLWVMHELGALASAPPSHKRPHASHRAIRCNYLREVLVFCS